MIEKFERIDLWETFGEPQIHTKRIWFTPRYSKKRLMYDRLSICVWFFCHFTMVFSFFYRGEFSFEDAVFYGLMWAALLAILFFVSLRVIKDTSDDVNN